MKLLLSHVEERRWLGIISLSLPLEDGGEEELFFKVTIFPTSSTQEWTAIVTPTLFVKLTKGKLERAIREGLERLASQELTCSDQQNLHSLLETHPEAWEEVLPLLRRERRKEGEGGEEVRDDGEVQEISDYSEEETSPPSSLEGGSLDKETPLGTNREGGE